MIGRDKAASFEVCIKKVAFRALAVSYMPKEVIYVPSKILYH